MQSNLLNEIQTVLAQKLDIKVYDYQTINRGYLNEKWVLHTNRGLLFTKSYHPDRYRKKYSTNVWQEIDQALQLQVMFHNSGGLCPELLGHEETGFIMNTPSGRKFVVMEHCPGQMVEAGKVNDLQMYSLGLSVSKMHNTWNTVSENTDMQQPVEPIWKPNQEEMIDSWNLRWDEAQSASQPIRNGLKLEREILDQVDFEQFNHASPGWTHLDLWVDNLLFMSDRLSAIVDFDRIRYSFPILDIGRVLLSCTLHEGTFRKDCASAFAEGYRKHRVLAKGELFNAVKYSWITESSWWIRVPRASFSATPKRFADEMMWTAAMWHSLDVILGDI